MRPGGARGGGDPRLCAEPRVPSAPPKQELMGSSPPTPPRPSMGAHGAAPALFLSMDRCWQLALLAISSLKLEGAVSGLVPAGSGWKWLRPLPELRGGGPRNEEGVRGGLCRVQPWGTRGYFGDPLGSPGGALLCARGMRWAHGVLCKGITEPGPGRCRNGRVP